jgi:hypothetical protein
MKAPISYAKLLPHGYLSYSALILWEQDKNKYYQRYFENLPSFKNKYIRVGKKLTTYLESGDYLDDEYDPLIELVGISFPDYPRHDFEIKAKLEGIPLMGKLDAFNRNFLEIGEYKSGKKWTQRMADKSDQLTFYALLVWLKYKKLPNKISLHWAKTIEDEAEKMVEMTDSEMTLTLTGDTKTFITKRDLHDIIPLVKRIKKAVSEIADLTRFNEIGRKGGL